MTRPDTTRRAPSGNLAVDLTDNAVSVPVRQIGLRKDSVTCEVELRQYVYGAFIHNADSITMGFGIRSTGAELLREEIAAALESWAACEADLQITSTIVADPPAEIDVNTRWR